MAAHFFFFAWVRRPNPLRSVEAVDHLSNRCLLSKNEGAGGTFASRTTKLELLMMMVVTAELAVGSFWSF